MRVARAGEAGQEREAVGDGRPQRDISALTRLEIDWPGRQQQTLAQA